MTNFEHMRERLYRRAGLLAPPPPKYNYLQLRASEWSPQFEEFMRNRMVMGALRYGTIAQNRAAKKPYDRIASVKKRLESYLITGNDELLVDCANLLMLEFELGQHPRKHFRAADSREHNVEVKPLDWKSRLPPYISIDEFKSDAGLRKLERAQTKLAAYYHKYPDETDKFADALKTNMTKWRADFESRTGRKPGLLDAWLSGSP